MSSFTIPPISEPFVTVKGVADRANCSREAVYNAIREKKISATVIAGRYLFAKSEVDRFIRDWPVRPNGKAVAARWREYRAFKAAMIAARSSEVAA